MFNRCQSSFAYNLAELDLSCNSRGDQSLRTLLPLWTLYGSLKVLSLAENRLTDRFLQYFFTVSLNLNYLDVSGNAFEVYELWLTQGISKLKEYLRLDIRKAYAKEGNTMIYREI